MQVPERVIARGALKQVVPLLGRHKFGHALMLVCDDTTWIAAGQELLTHLAPHYRVTTYSLGLDVQADRQHADEIVRAAQGMDGLISVGSGTINDITKYAAAELGKPYLSVATAASMNGYTSANASLQVEGLKRSFSAKRPRAVLADLDVILAAPLRLAQSGLGDTLCRSTVEADILLSHLLLGTPYPRMIFDRLRRDETMLIDHAERLITHDANYIAALMETLLDAGDAMSEHGSSAVASQGEHMIAHTLELLYPEETERLRHGELVAVATLAMAEIQETLLQAGPPVLAPLPHKPSAFLKVFGQYQAEGLADAYAKKLLSEDKATKLNKKIAHDWPEIKRQIDEIRLPAEVLEHALLLAGVPTRSHDLKLDIERYKYAVTHAYMTRERFTFLDLAAMTEARS